MTDIIIVSSFVIALVYLVKNQLSRLCIELVNISNISKVKYTISDDSLRNYSDIRLTTDLEIRPPTKLLDKILSDSLINIIKQFNSVH